MICPICRHAEDDHNEVGTCNKCCMHGGPCSGFDVPTLKARLGGKPRWGQIRSALFLEHRP